jgi:hypothetical protein
MAFSAPIFMKLLISYQVLMSSLGSKFYPKPTNILLYNMALVNEKKVMQFLYSPGQTLRVPGV